MRETDDETTSETIVKINQAFSPIHAIDRQAKPDYTNTSQNAKIRRITPRKLILSVGFIILVITALTFFVSVYNNRASTSPNDQIKSVFSGEELKDYTPPDGKFTILMPGLPEISMTTVKHEDKEIPAVVYERVIDNGIKNYRFVVYDYSGIQLDKATALDNALNNAVASTPSAQLISSKLGKYNELDAIEASYKTSGKDVVYNTHFRCVIKGSTLYVITLEGSDQSKFDAFANSLRIN